MTACHRRGPRGSQSICPNNGTAKPSLSKNSPGNGFRCGSGTWPTASAGHSARNWICPTCAGPLWLIGSRPRRKNRSWRGDSKRPRKSLAATLRSWPGNGADIAGCPMRSVDRLQRITLLRQHLKPPVRIEEPHLHHSRPLLESICHSRDSHRWADDGIFRGALKQIGVQWHNRLEGRTPCQIG